MGALGWIVGAGILGIVVGCSEGESTPGAPTGGAGGTGGQVLAPLPATGGTTLATGGAGSGGAPTLAGPIQRGELLVLEFEGRKLTVDPREGARITSLTFEGTELLTQESEHDDNFGSTFWTSPQSDWSWPPPEALDRAEYAFEVGANSFAVESSPSDVQDGRVVARKEFSVDFVAGAFVLRYALENVGSETIRVAPWEVTRVRPNGLTFFPTGTREVKTPDLDLLFLEKSGGVSFFDHAAWERGSAEKVNADALEGFVAHATGSVLFVKTWTDVAASAQHEEEGEVGLFADPDGGYVEVENQGALVELVSGAEVFYEVRWFVAGLPSTVEVAVGSAALVEFARQTGGL